MRFSSYIAVVWLVIVPVLFILGQYLQITSFLQKLKPQCLGAVSILLFTPEGPGMGPVALMYDSMFRFSFETLAKKSVICFCTFVLAGNRGVSWLTIRAASSALICVTGSTA